MKKASHLTQCELIDYTEDDGKPLCRILAFTEPESGGQMWELHKYRYDYYDDGDAESGPSLSVEFTPVHLVTGLGPIPAEDEIRSMLVDDAVDTILRRECDTV